MSADSVITVENLGKRYTLRAEAPSATLREQLTRTLTGPARWLRSNSAATPSPEDFWALREVDFSVNRGEVVGIIGRNGAGKSTLLKILSRITEPTTGRVTIHGRVASLLEVGTGFHGELSGRENIFLNGAILGMKHAEIRRKFDEIVAFAEVARFIDTPVKRYSTGMYMRLAFAVAAHLEPDILVVDEVLAVGDAAFQKKCLGKIREVSSQSGRTVLFVSHQSSALLSICQSALWLNQGRVIKHGPIREVMAGYHAEGSVHAARFAPAPTTPSITSITLSADALADGDLEFHVGFHAPAPLRPPVVGLIIYNRLGQPVAGANTRMTGPEWQPPAARVGTLIARVKLPPLNSDTYRVSVWLGDATQDYDQKLDALTFDYVSPEFHPRSPPVDVIGPLRLDWQWSIKPSAD